MELPKYIQDKIKRQNEYVKKAKDLQIEIERWCSLSNIDVRSEEYKKIKGLLSDEAAPMDSNKISECHKFDPDSPTALKTYLGHDNGNKI